MVNLRFLALIVVAAVFPHVLAKDLDIRFSKVVVDPQYNLSSIELPLTSTHYPISSETFQWLRYVLASTVIIPEVCEECYWSFDDLIEVAGGYPSHPSTDETSSYWTELEHVVEIQKLRRQNVDPKSIMPLPGAWVNFTIKEVADAVHDEFLGIFHIGLLTTWDKAKTIKIDRNIIPFGSIVDFIRSNCMLADLVTWAIARVGPSNFALKWHVGLARPEEVAFKIATGAITEGPSPSLVESIKAFNLSFATNFTAYPEGSPKHPSWPAMHSASSAASLWMPVLMLMTPEQYCQVQLTDYAIAYARTVAGVHYQADNLAGLKLGQEIVARLLPDFLHEKYGTSKTRVEAKIASLRFSWDDFLGSDCAKGLI
jgi:hypothetical protein